MTDCRLIQAIGRMAAHEVGRKYPAIYLRFFADPVRNDMRIYIAYKKDVNDRTGRLYEVGKLPQDSPLVIKDVARSLEVGIEQQVRLFLNIEQSGSV